MKLKAFVDDKLDVVEIMISLFYRVENTVGKEENAGNLHFLLFPQCFPKPSSLGWLKVGLCGKALKSELCGKEFIKHGSCMMMVIKCLSFSLAKECICDA